MDRVSGRELLAQKKRKREDSGWGPSSFATKGHYIGNMDFKKSTSHIA
jgi:hypothetical protein